MIDSTDRAIGCGWALSQRSPVSLLLQDEDWAQRPSNVKKCSLCFKHARLPDTWQEDLESGDDSPSASTTDGSSI
eukprot:6470113-Amphidinium_carterae.1